MPDPREPLWVPYSPPPATWGDAISCWLRRYGFGLALAVSISSIAIVLWWVPDYSREERSGLAVVSTAQGSIVPGGVMTAGNPFIGAAELYIFTEPWGVTVVAEGDTLGQTPLVRELLPAGSRRMQFLREGYVTIDTTLLIRSDQFNWLELAMVAEESAASPRAPSAPRVMRAFAAPLQDLDTARAEQRTRVQEFLQHLRAQQGDEEKAEEEQVGEEQVLELPRRGRVGW